MRGSSLRFLGRFIWPAASLEEEREIAFDVGGDLRSATLYLPRPRAGRQPGGRGPAWILLQGVTVPGRHHAGVRRMARALASAGHTALAPEVPPWTSLHVDPAQAETTIRAALRLLPSLQSVDPERIGLMAFSVAGTWALEVAAGELGRQLRCAVSLGGYGDFRRTSVAMLIGEHEWQGRSYRYLPDPYGRWIVGADLLPRLQGDAWGAPPERQQAAQALHRLAWTAGRNGAPAGSPVYDLLIAQLRQTVPAGTLRAWDLLAPPSSTPVPDPDAGRALALALADAALEAFPQLDPAGRLEGLAAHRLRLFLIHGRQDTLIPFTETLRLAAAMPRGARPTVTITRLIGHAKAALLDLVANPPGLAYETVRFLMTMRRLVASLER